MHSLVVAHSKVWPARFGNQRRIDTIVRDLAGRGPVTVIEPDLDPTAPTPATTRIASDYSSGTQSRVRRLFDLLRLRPPELARGCGSNLDAMLDVEPDLVWYTRVGIRAAHPVAANWTAPVVVDLDDNEAEKLRGIARLPDTPLRRRLQLKIHTAAWSSTQRRLGSEVDVLAVSNPSDVDRVPAPTVILVPNVFTAPTASRRGADVGPILLFVGLLGYAANLDALRWFTRECLPLVRAEVPEVVLRVVGAQADRAQWLATIPNVDLVGGVDDTGPELARAAVSVIPLRYGGGTRLKALEAFAHGVPVVSTSVGIEGLGVLAGQHALVDDEPAGFAARCVELLEDPAQRARIAEDARVLLETHHSPDRLHAAIDEVLTAVGIYP